MKLNNHIEYWLSVTHTSRSVLCRALRVHKTTVSAWVRNKKQPNKKNVKRIQAFFENKTGDTIPMDKLFFIS